MKRSSNECRFCLGLLMAVIFRGFLFLEPFGLPLRFLFVAVAVDIVSIAVAANVVNDGAASLAAAVVVAVVVAVVAVVGIRMRPLASLLLSG